jgi:hypothetical protein
LYDYVLEQVGEISFEVGVAAVVDPINMRMFTQGTCQAIFNAYPSKNVMIVHGSFQQTFVNPVHVHYELPLVPIAEIERTYGYEIYTFDSGTFNLSTPGGYENWAFEGNFTRNGNSLVFSPRGESLSMSAS